MRDFSNGGDIKAGGDINISDNSQNEYKLYIHCSSEELIADRPFRQGNIKLEQKRKIKRLAPFYGLSVLLFISAAAWSTFNGQKDLASLMMKAGSLLLGIMSVTLTIEPNAFQVEERYAVNEINKILRQRRVE